MYADSDHLLDGIDARPENASQGISNRSSTAAANARDLHPGSVSLAFWLAKRGEQLEGVARTGHEANVPLDVESAFVFMLR